MRKIGRDSVRETLENRQAAGHHIDPRLLIEVDNEGQLYLLQFEDEASFLSLIWQESPPARLLTPEGQSRTLLDVSTRLIQKGYTFEKLSRDLGLSANQHQPEWFARCIHIDTGFDFAHFGWIAVVYPKDSEREQSPTGSFYIFDGVHKTLVLAKRLLKGETVFQPIEALLLIPRR